jgi:hypothetical protein
MSMIAIKDVIIGERHRREMGDVAGLAASIEAVGLLHPPVVDKNNVLVAGERRIRAALLLGWTDISVTVIDIAEIVLGEYAENEVRKDFTLSEAVAIKRTIEPAFAAEAKGRQGRRTDKHSAKFLESAGGDSRDKIAKATGKSHTTLSKAEKVVEAAEAEPEKFGPLVEEMDRTGKVDGVYKRLNTSKVSPGDTAKANPIEQTFAPTQAASNAPTPTGAMLINFIEQLGRIDVSTTIWRMSNDDRIAVLAHIVNAVGALNKMATDVSVSGGAHVGKLAPVPLRLEALAFLKAATVRIEAELAGRAASPAQPKAPES